MWGLVRSGKRSTTWKKSPWRWRSPARVGPIGRLLRCFGRPRSSDLAGQIRRANRLLTDDDIRALITALDNLRDVIRDAGPAEKAASYDQFDLKVTFKPGEAKIRAEVTIGPENYIEHAGQCGDTGRVRAGTDPIPSPYPPHCSMCYSADVDLQQTGRPYAS